MLKTFAKLLACFIFLLLATLLIAVVKEPAAYLFSYYHGEPVSVEIVEAFLLGFVYCIYGLSVYNATLRGK